ncbi:MAG: hypothetical protein ACK2T7_07185 [Anaerolineales bacterium]
MKADKPRRAAFLKVLLAALLTAASGMGMLYIYQLVPTTIGVGYAWLAALGVAAGLFSRIVLGRHTGALRFTAALFSVIAGLWAADWITRGFIGFEIFDLRHPTPDFTSLTELGIGWLAALLALRAWKKRPVKVVPPAPQPEPAPQPAPVPTTRPASTQVYPMRVRLAGAAERTRTSIRAAMAPVISRITSWPPKRVSRPVSLNLGRRIASEPAGHMMVVSAPPALKSVAVSPPPAKPLSPSQVKPKQVKQRKKKENLSGVKLVGAESHRCPFCLEDIDLHDPRGVKICPICKTYHHADCWDVTGMCQIPHHQE